MKLWIGHAEKRRRVLAAIRGGARYGVDIAAASGMNSGRVYATLAELETDGLIRSDWELETDGLIRSDWWDDPRAGRVRRAYRLSWTGHRATE